MSDSDAITFSYKLGEELREDPDKFYRILDNVRERYTQEELEQLKKEQEEFRKHFP